MARVPITPIFSFGGVFRQGYDYSEDAAVGIFLGRYSCCKRRRAWEEAVLQSKNDESASFGKKKINRFFGVAIDKLLRGLP